MRPLHTAAAAAGFAALLGLAVTSHVAAARYHQGQRLRSYVTVRRPIAAATRLAATDLRVRVGRLPPGVDPVQDPGGATGLYTLVDLRPGMAIPEACLSDHAPGAPDAGGVMLPVQVTTEHVIGLQPGMLVAFAADSQLVPDADALRARRGTGFRLLSITRSTRDPAISTLMVSVPTELLASVGVLATASWRPVIVSPTPPPAPGADSLRQRVADCPRGR